LEEYNLEGDKEEGYISQKSFIKSNEIAVEKIKSEMENQLFLTEIFIGNLKLKI